MILKWILNECIVKMWTDFMCFGLGSNSRHFWTL